MLSFCRPNAGKRRVEWGIFTTLSIRTALATALVGGALGCDIGAPAAPDFASPLSPPLPAVGPAPLRRVTNDEYVNALHDLFPALNLQLPALPEDLTVDGFDNAAETQEPSDVLIARYETIANLYAQAATANRAGMQALVGCQEWVRPEVASGCASQFVATTGRRVFRRPLTSDEQSRYLLHFKAWQSAVDFEGAVQLTLSAMLQSPQFIYRPEPLPPARVGSVIPVDPYAMATRLSFFLWESVPDDLLLDAASHNELTTDAQLRAQAARMLGDPRAKRALWNFPRQWLGLDRILLSEDAVRTPQVDPGWTTATQTSASLETEYFVENTLTQGGTLRDLLTSRRAWVDGEMSRLYGLPAPLDPTAWAEVTLPASERAGFLTRVSYLAGYSHAGATSPPVRGNAIQLRLLCQLPVSPPPNANLSQPMAAPDAGPETNRMLFEQRTAPPACQACHVALNGFGFGLENYNAAGRYQTTDNGLPVDASGTILGTDVDGPFTGGIALSEALSKSGTVHNCATQELIRYAFGRAPVDAEAPTVAALSTSFMQSSGDLHALMISVVLSPSFRTRLVEDD